jgi:D-alanyl-D-alanine carboxypeptidase
LYFTVFYATEDQAGTPLEEQLESRLKEMETPGALVGIFKPDGSSQQFALGLANLKSKKPMQLEMHMRMGSITKLFVGTVALQLADEGKISLDDPVSKYISGVPAGTKISLRQLGNHTSGLYNSIEDRKFQQAIMDNPEKDWTAKEVLQYAFNNDSYFAPGADFRYSNTNTILLGMIIEKVTGKPWIESLNERIFKPLELKHTGLPSKKGDLPEPHPSAYRNSDGERIIGYGSTFHDVSHYSASSTGAAGNLYSTLNDLGRAIHPLATGQLLKTKGKEELHKWVSTRHKGWQYGFCIGNTSGAIGHQGDVPGFNAIATYFPELNYSIVVLTNLSNNKDGTMPAEELSKLVASYLKKNGDPP